MCSRWCVLALVACVLVNVVVDGDVNRVVGTRCNPGRKGSWGLWCNVKWECDGPKKTRSDRCREGETAPPPRVVCCPQEGPAPPEEVTVAVVPVKSGPPEEVTVAVGTVKPGPSEGVTVAVETVKPASRRTTTKKSKKKTTTKMSKKVITPKMPMETTTIAASIVVKPLSVKDAVIVAKKKCVEYNRHVYVEEYPQVLLPGDGPVNVSHCLMVGQKLIAGGVLTDYGEFPHMVALGYEPPGRAVGVVEWHCGGSLISEHFVLTAAHCVYDRRTGPVRYALLGGTDLNDPKAQRIKVAEALKHPAYKPPSIYDDIALLRLESPPKMSPVVRPACIGNKEPAPNVAPGKFGTSYDVTGWGLLNDSEKSERLMKVDLYEAAMEKCDEKFKFIKGLQKLMDGVRRDSMMCIGNKAANKDSCQGDSGGPAQTQLNGTDIVCMYNIDGVTSFGERTCGLADFSVSIYTRVYHFLPWIVPVVWPEEVVKT